MPPVLFNDITLDVKPDGLMVIKVQENPVISKVFV
jgi:hypothetical protein